MVRGYHLQIGCHPLLFHNIKKFNIKDTAAHHSVIWKEVDELLAKDTIKPSINGTGFYWNVIVVPKCTGGLWNILKLKQLNYYMHIPTFKMPYSQTDKTTYSTKIMLFLLMWRMPICIFLLLNIILVFMFCLAFGMATAHRIFTSLTKLILFLAGTRIFVLSEKGNLVRNVLFIHVACKSGTTSFFRTWESSKYKAVTSFMSLIQQGINIGAQGECAGIHIC